MLNHSAVEITEENFNDFVIESRIPFLVLFVAKTTVMTENSTCRLLADTLQKLSDEWIGKMFWGIVYVDQIEYRIISDYNIKSIPSFLVFDGGKVVCSSVGVFRNAEIREKLSPFLE